MDKTIRSALLCMGICLGIFAAAQWLTAVLGGQMIEREWGGLIAVFSSGG